MTFEWKFLKGSFEEVAFEQAIDWSGGRDGSWGFLSSGNSVDKSQVSDRPLCPLEASLWLMREPEKGGNFTKVMQWLGVKGETWTQDSQLPAQGFGLHRILSNLLTMALKALHHLVLIHIHYLHRRWQPVMDHASSLLHAQTGKWRPTERRAAWGHRAGG